MFDLPEKLEALAAAQSTEDVAAIAAAHRAVIDEDPLCPEATESRYRLGLITLMVEANREKAMALFREAAKDRQGGDPAQAARVAYAACLYGAGKKQPALLELKRCVPEGATPTLHTVAALELLVSFLKQDRGSAAEITAYDALRVAHLERLAAGAQTPEEQASLWLRLAAAHAEKGAAGDLALAKDRLERIVALGARAGADQLDAAQAMLATIGR